MFELRHLRYFLAVAEHRHFGRAAEQLGIVQPALSMQIRSLEDELGAKLFIRTSRKVDLTEAGELLIEEARRTIAQAGRAAEVVRMSALGVIGRVSIGFSGNASFGSRLTEDLRSFHRSSPDVEITLREMPATHQAEAIIAGELDLGYCPSFAVTQRPELRVEDLGRWPWFVAMSADHALAGRREVSGPDLADEAFVLYAGHDADAGQMDVLRSVLGLEPRVSHRVGNTLAVLTVAAAGLALALVPGPLTTVTVPGIAYRPLGGAGGTADLVRLSRLNPSAGAVRKFLDLARRTATARA